MISRIIALLGFVNNARRQLCWWISDKILHGRSASMINPRDKIEICNIRAAVVCIAKDEDHYIDEWIDYHLKLGFDDIFIYQNNWRYSGSCQRNNVHWLTMDGEAKQLTSYNSFIKDYSDSFDYAAFIDVDEFICLVRDDNIKEFLCNYSKFGGIALNWRYFGDNGQTMPVDGNYSLLKRFTRCGWNLNKHIKTIVHFNGSQVSFCSPHNLAEAICSDITIAVDGKSFVRGPFLYRPDFSIAWINHYYSKTYEEFISHKKFRGRSDLNSNDLRQVYNTNTFHKCNLNDVENLIALQRFLQ